MKKVFEYVLALFLILSCNSVYFVMVSKDYHINFINIILFLIVLFLHIFSKSLKKEKFLKSLIFIFFYYTYIILFILLNNVNDMKNFVSVFCLAFPIMFLVYNTSENNRLAIEILGKIPIVMCVISIISLFFYLFGSLSHIIRPTEYVKIGWGEIHSISSYYGVYFETQEINLFGLHFFRNTSIFPEAPMYSLNLTIALAIELFLIKRRSKFIKNTLLLSVFTTTSATGISITSMMLIFSLIISKQKSSIRKIIKLLILPCIVIVLGSVSLFFFNERKQTASYFIRLDDYKACYLAWKEHPIFGNGFNNRDSIIKYMSSSRKYNQGLSNSLLVILAQCGIYLFSFYFISFYKCIRYGILYKKKDNIIFLLVIIILSISAIFPYRLLLINILAYFMSLPLNNKKSEEIGNEI